MRDIFEFLIIVLIIFLLIVFLIFLIVREIKKKLDKRKKYKKYSKHNNKEVTKEKKIKIGPPEELKIEESPSYIPSRVVNYTKYRGNKSQTQYHINFAGKIYPCKNNGLNCPTGLGTHSYNKVELYYKLITSNRIDAEPDKNVLKEILDYKQLSSLYFFSSSLEKVHNPIEVILVTLGTALTALDPKKVKEESFYQYSKRHKFENEIATDIANFNYLWGDIKRLRSFIPIDLMVIGNQKFRDKYKEERKYDDKERWKKLKNIEERLKAKINDIQNYEKDKRWGLNENPEYDRFFSWLYKAFERFAHDLNTSKIIEQPLLYEKIEVAIEKIKNMEDKELLAVFDDFSATDEEIEENVKKANYFNYNYREDLTKEANESMSRWYAKNRENYLKYIQLNPSIKQTLATEVAKEIERRGLFTKQNNVFMRGELS